MILGDESELYCRTVWAEDFQWVSLPEQTDALAVTAKTRYSQGETEAVLYPESLVAYVGDAVVGGGVICRAQ